MDLDLCSDEEAQREEIIVVDEEFVHGNVQAVSNTLETENAACTSAPNSKTVVHTVFKHKSIKMILPKVDYQEV